MAACLFIFLLDEADDARLAFVLFSKTSRGAGLECGRVLREKEDIPPTGLNSGGRVRKEV